MEFVLTDKVPAPKVRLWLESTMDGDIHLRASFTDGSKPMYVMKFKKDGTFYRAGVVSEKLGFQLDAAGRIKESN